MKVLRLVGFAALCVLHQDVWLWSDATIVFGLPVGLTYHVGLCLAASLLFLSLTRSFLPDRNDP